jgi:hypothetical protein
VRSLAVRCAVPAWRSPTRSGGTVEEHGGGSLPIQGEHSQAFGSGAIPVVARHHRGRDKADIVDKSSEGVILWK